MRSLSMLVVGAALLLSPSETAAQEDLATAKESLNQFRTTWREAWSRQDAEALAALVAEDVDWIAADGTWLKGRKAFQEHHTRLFARQFKGAKWKLLDERVQMIDTDVGLTISATQIQGDTHGDGTGRKPRSSVGTRVITRNGDKWLLKLSHNTIITPVPPN